MMWLSTLDSRGCPVDLAGPARPEPEPPKPTFRETPRTTRVASTLRADGDPQTAVNGAKPGQKGEPEAVA